ncbi:MAG: hypothetical protein ACWIPH_06955 [Ostreibacterium sp.]
MIDSAVWSLIRTDLKALGDKIKELDPNVELISLTENHENIKNKIREIDRDLEQLVQESNEFDNEKLSDFMAFGKKLRQNVSRLKKTKSILVNDVQKLETQIINIKSKIDTQEKLIDVNVEYIESSKEKVQLYVNHFIESVRVQIHNKSISVLQLKLKYYSKNNTTKKVLSDGNFRIDDGLDKFITLVIDKNNTLKIGLYKEAKRIADENIQHFLNKIDYRNQFTQFKYVKLKLYDKRYGND